jgi:Fatty acid desaturase
MHRRLIHRSYDCPLWLERLFVYLGTLVGMAGPYGMIRQHDIRDWAQRKPCCHPYLAHRNSILRDGWWQLHCELQLVHPPELGIERRVAEDRFYRFIERTWMAQQLPWAALFFALGGMPWLVWGIAVRMAMSITGHWLVGYFAHNRGPRSWHVEGAGVQGYNVPYCGLITMGEAWHNNHHAFPGSARLGLGEGERSGVVGAAWTAAGRPGLGHQDARDFAAPSQSRGAADLTARLFRVAAELAQQRVALLHVLQRPENAQAHARRRAPCDFGLVNDASIGLDQIEVLGHAVGARDTDVCAPVRLVVDRAVDHGMTAFLQDAASRAVALALWILGRLSGRGICGRDDGGALSQWPVLQT